MKRILVTGFTPFHAETKNPSQEVLSILKQGSRCETLLLPVSYRRATDHLLAHLRDHTYDFIFMLGQAGGRKLIGFERVAINLIDGEIPDEDGAKINDQRILSQGPDAYLSPLPLREWIEGLKAKNFPVEISNTAGTFVCNALYFQVVHALKVQKSSAQALFIHLPYMLEQLTGKTADTPAISLQIMEETINTLLEIV